MAYLKEVTHADAEAGYWTGQTFDFDAVVTNTLANPLGCSRCTLKWKRTVPTGLSEDLVMCTLSFGKVVAGHQYVQGSSADLATLEGHLSTWWGVVKAYVTTQFTLVEYAWHGVSKDSPRTEDGRGQKMGPAVRTTVLSVAGTDSVGRSPDQLATNLTMRTASRKHWGRMFIPGIGVDKWDTTYGRLTTTVIDGIASASDSLHTNAQGAGFEIGVWSQLHPAFLTAKSVEVDDVPDIQRRRRAKRRNYAKIYP